MKFNRKLAKRKVSNLIALIVVCLSVSVFFIVSLKMRSILDNATSQSTSQTVDEVYNLERDLGNAGADQTEPEVKQMQGY